MTSTTTTAVRVKDDADAIINLKPMWIGLGVMTVFYLIVRVYEQIFGWRAGLDSFAPEFQTYWLIPALANADS